MKPISLAVAIAATLASFPAIPTAIASATDEQEKRISGSAPAEAAAPDRRDDDRSGRGPETPETLKSVVVTSIPFGRVGDQLVTPVSVLAGAALDAARAGSIGETVSGVPGVQNAAYGNGAGRPVIRGLDGSRVAILSGGLGSADVSNVSQDHATTIEPFLADQIEILKGPSTLLYGSGAIGGVVNAVDGRIPERAPEQPFSGRAQIHHDSTSNGGTGLIRLDAGGTGYAVHVDGLRRQQGDYATPDGRLDNSFVHTKTGAIGGSLLGDWGFAGLSMTRHLNHYGNPAEPGDEDHDEPAVHVAVEQTRHDFKAGLDDPLRGMERVDLAVGYSDYRHVEYEGDEAGTVFGNRSREARLQLIHQPLSGWRGAFGIQTFDKDFSAIGEESFVPPTSSNGVGLFIAEQKDFGPVKVELGARRDHQTSTPKGGDRRRFNPLSWSVDVGWHVSEQWHWSLNLDRAQRAPAEEELFAHGPHAASATFEIGDASLKVESAHQAELGLHYHTDKVDAKLSTYYNRFNDFIFLADTGEMEDDYPVRQWSQADARFRGYEAEATFHLSSGGQGHYDLRVWTDHVRATLVDGGNLPRIPAARWGSELLWRNDDWRARIGVVHYLKQDRTARYESPTPAFSSVTAGIDWTFFSTERAQFEAYFNASNLSNQTQRLATSLIKDQVPLPGRNITLGLRAFF